MVAPNSLPQPTDNGQNPLHDRTWVRWRPSFGRLKWVAETDLVLHDSGYVLCESAIVLESPVKSSGRGLFYRPCRQCKTCRARYRRRVRDVASIGLQESTSAYAYFVTLTAPGAETDLQVWNGEHGARWNHFVTILRREASPGAQYFRGCEVQKRGALHDHILLLTDTPLTKHRVKTLAKRAGYGYMVDFQQLHGEESRARASRYVSKYVTKSTGERSSVPWPHHRRTTRGKATFRTWSRSTAYGCTMAEARRRAFNRWAAQESGNPGKAGSEVQREPHSGAAEPVPVACGPPC